MQFPGDMQVAPLNKHPVKYELHVARLVSLITSVQALAEQLEAFDWNPQKFPDPSDVRLQAAAVESP